MISFIDLHFSFCLYIRGFHWKSSSIPKYISAISWNISPVGINEEEEEEEEQEQEQEKDIKYLL